MRWSEPRPLEDLEHELEVSLATEWAEKVKQLYAAGRFAAHQALEGLGSKSSAIPRGDSGAPIWPEGTVGSITHTEGIALAVVGAEGKVTALGIDIEKEGRVLSSGLVEKVSSDKEKAWIRGGDSNFRLLRVLSAKEAIFKAVFSLAQIRLGFLEAELEEKEGGFSVKILHSRVSKEWPTLKFFLNQSIWNGYLVSALCLKGK